MHAVLDRAAIHRIQSDGYAILPRVFPPDEVDRIGADLDRCLTGHNESLLKAAGGPVFAARNVADWFPAALALWQKQDLLDLLLQTLGANCGLVRILFFDKPPGNTWSLPWHRDKTIAVKDNRLPSTLFLHPTTKAHVPHLEAPPSVLQHMLTLRLHLDEVDEENGPLRVIAGSHRSSPEQQRDENLGEMRTICVHRGDVLAIRPLVSHSSSASKPGTKRHRRILHFEFSGQPCLPDGFCWRMFIPPGTATL